MTKRQLQRYKRLWESATPEGSPTSSRRRGAGTETEVPINYKEERDQEKIAEWVRQLRDTDTGSDSSSTTIVQRSKARAGSTPNRRGDTSRKESWATIREEIAQLEPSVLYVAEQEREEIKAGMEQMEQRVVSMTERAHEELQEAVEAGLSMIHDQTRMQACEQTEQLKNKMENESKAKAEEEKALKQELGTRLGKIEKAITNMATEQKNMAKHLWR